MDIIYEKYDLDEVQSEYIEQQNELNIDEINHQRAYSDKCYEAFQKLYSNEFEGQQLSPTTQYLRLPQSERDYYILNRDTGTLVDARDLEQPSPQKIRIEQAWLEYWSHVTQLNHDVLQAAQLGDHHKILNIIEACAHTYPLDLNVKDSEDQTALHFACAQKNYQLAMLLITNDALIDPLNIQQRTPLHYCALRNQIEIAQELIKKQANLNCQDFEMNTPLHLASLYGNAQFCELLLQTGCNHELKNQQQFQAIELSQNSEILQIFKDKGIKLSNNQYTRTQLSDINILISNSRQDHVLRFLKLASSQKHKRDTITIEEVVKEQNQLEQSSARSTWDKIVNLAIRFTKVKIFGKSEEAFRDSQGQEHQNFGIHSFTFYQQIGEGGFGSVHLVERNNKLYAMKIQPKHSLSDTNIVESAKVEKDILQIMDHPFIVKLHFAFQTNQDLYLVMDFCPGGDLSQTLELKNRLSEDVVKIYAAEITLALEALHKNGIIFRDLKPQNIVLDEDGHAMLTDFGLSKKDADEYHLNNSFCGTLAYLAPEVLTKRGHGRQVDWYMLGILIYELLVGVTPYFDEAKEILKDNILRGPLKIPKSFSREVKDLIIKVLFRYDQLLHRDPKQRLGSREDGKEVREHEWFSSIDWQQCYNKQLSPPKPLILTTPKLSAAKNKNIQKNHKDRIDQWTFVDEDLQQNQ